MKYLHYNVTLQKGDQVVVTLDRQANVLLLDSSNYHRYKSGNNYKYYGGLATTSPTSIAAPFSGVWHVVINLGGYAGTVHASVQIRKL